ncbi:MAG: hypothetical protein C4527_18890 [Candidatus Omnitrophota bacterium]|jgi:outer membrane protein assembly factor BamB|nr:MAG: hypothetical protein C4527_18890 [Candidatus Omnitrophota bacterium]
MKKIPLIVVFLVPLLCDSAFAEDWPTYMHDITRSGVSGEQLQVPMKETWVFKSTHAPQPAWPAPAWRDYWHHRRELRPLVTFDRAFPPVIAGDALYFGSSADDKVYCLDAATGNIRWTFFTEGPIRLAPTIANGKAYIGSDDGIVYCLNAGDGKLIWKRRPAPKDQRLPGNSRMISLHPIRTGILVDNNIAYCFSGLFPEQGVYRCALDANDGSIIWQDPVDNISPQGYLLASRQRLFAPTGRTSPAVFDREKGNYLGMVETEGGAYTLLTPDTVISGPGRRVGELSLTDTDTKERIASFDGLRMIVNGDMAYMLSENQLSALNRTRHIELARQRHVLNKRRAAIEEEWKKLRRSGNGEKRQELAKEIESIQTEADKFTQLMDGCYLWKSECVFPYAMILAGEILFVGGDDMIAAYRADNGEELWTAGVSGRANELAAANGSLFVGTDKGMMYCFSAPSVPRRGYVRSSVERNPYPQDDLTPFYTAAARQIVDQSGVKKGYCLVLDAGEGRLAYELARLTDLQIIGIEPNPIKVASARAILDNAGFYGSRIAIHQGSLADIQYVNYFANLIVSEKALRTGEVPANSAELARILKPNGGIMLIGQPAQIPNNIDSLTRTTLDSWLEQQPFSKKITVENNGLWASVRRGALAGEGEWTHLYADVNNTACSKDRIQGPMGVQWFGKPGPRNIVDRHHRPMSPLYKNGRLYISANDGIIVADAYNGAPLWEIKVPFSRRIGALKDCGYMAVTDEYLYVTGEDQCQAFHVETGENAFILYASQSNPDNKKDWGYIAVVEDQIFGSCTKPGASFYELSEETCDMLEGDFREMIYSDSLFSQDRHTGEVLWTYKNGAIMNSAITIGDGQMYFIESRNSTTLADFDGRISAHLFCAGDAYLVALDLQTGKTIREQPFQFPFEHIMFLSYADQTILAVGTYNQGRFVHYGLYAFDAADAKLKWNNSYQGEEIGGTHGEQWQHPVIIGDTVFSRPYAFNLHTGKQENYKLHRGGHGCGGLSASASYLFGRGANPRLYEIHEGEEKGTPLTLVNRPGCWINIIPAGGLVLLPESSAGCTCAYPMQLSIAFSPRD